MLAARMRLNSFSGMSFISIIIAIAPFLVLIKPTAEIAEGAEHFKMKNNAPHNLPQYFSYAPIFINNKAFSAFSANSAVNIYPLCAG
jgi:hypothetical protein